MSQSFTDLILDYTKDYESPSSFWRWSSYAMIAASLRTNVYFEHRAAKMYPNIFVLFIADSAEWRKGAPIDLASGILSDIKVTKVIEGRNSIQWVIEKLSTDVGKLKGGQAILLSEELASFFVDDKSLIPTLTDMYDFKAEFPYGLRGNSGSIVVKNRCVTMLAASNEQFLREVYDSRAVYGGLMRRTFFVAPDARRPAASFFDLTAMDPVKKKAITDTLTKISQLAGPMIASQNAQSLYNDWYKNKVYPLYGKSGDRTGVIGSMHTSALKLAMILAASEQSLIISDVHMASAIDQVLGLRGNYQSYSMATGKSTQAGAASAIILALHQAPKFSLSRSEILRNAWNELGTLNEFDQLLAMLTQAEYVKMVVVGNAEGYELTPKCINKLTLAI